MPNITGLYRGYNSFEFQAKKTFKLTDVELVKSDLLNHIFTRSGERIMMSNFGTIIPELVFEPLDDITVELLTEELRRVFEYDPRVEIIEFTVTPAFDESMVTAHARLFYIELNMEDNFDLNIEFQGA
ncbi:MAG: GPW/gp25 family protein [Nitrosopumilaceae archaeon]